MNTARRISLHTVLIAVALVFLLPSVWAIVSSLKTETEYYGYPIKLFPRKPYWENYYLALTMAPFLKFARNSFFLASTTTVLTTFTSALAGFGFARLRGPGRNALFMVVVAMIMIPGTAVLIPQFIMYARLGFMNTYWPWILGGATGSAWHIFLYRQFFAGFPKELEDAAEVDGCSRFRIFWQIFLPNSLPVVATSSIFLFGWVWGDYVGPSLYLSMDNATLAVALSGNLYVNPQGMALPMVKLAATVMYVIPMIVLFFFGQKYIIRGVVTTGLKG
jgi:multiple sugar transport system permease protein